MKRIPLARCGECDRMVYEDEGSISEYYLGKFGLCRECMEELMEDDYREMDKADYQMADR